MSRQDFELIARTIRALPVDVYGPEQVAAAFAAALAQTNPRFDKGRFMAACGAEL